MMRVGVWVALACTLGLSVAGCKPKVAPLVGSWAEVIVVQKGKKDPGIRREISFYRDGTYEDNLFDKSMNWRRTVRGQWALVEKTLTATPKSVQYLPDNPSTKAQLIKQLPKIDMSPDVGTLEFTGTDQMRFIPGTPDSKPIQFKRIGAAPVSN